MWKFSGTIQYKCTTCGDNSSIPIDDFEIECIGGSERSMGSESIHGTTYEFDCPKCTQPISLAFEASEYPVECLNSVLNNSSGAQTVGEPEFEYLREIYSAEDVFQFYESIPGLVSALKSSPYLLRDLSPQEFEEVVTEVFRKDSRVSLDISHHTFVTCGYV